MNIENELFRRGIYSDISKERLRQAEKFDDQEPGELGELSDWKMLPVLTEEVGEVSKELNDRGPDAKLYDELIQVAAVAVKWCEIVRRRNHAK